MSRRTERKATDEDILPLVTLVNSAYRGESSKKGWTTEEHLLGGQRIDEGRVQEILGTANQTILVWPAEHSTDESIKKRNGPKAGTLDACVLLEERNGYGYLGMLTVSPDLQNAGLGRLMLQISEDFFRSRNLFYIRMTVIEGRNELISWYVRRGYQLTGETQDFPMEDPRFGVPKQEHLQFVVLEKSLPQNPAL